MQQPDFARAVALARKAREPRFSANVLVFAAILAAGLHGASVIASLGAAVDVPSARTREVDVMKLSKIAAIGAVSVASSAWAGGKVPPGWMVVADSLDDFGSVQPNNGWEYLFDRGPGTEPRSMVRASWPEHAGSYTSWAAAPVMGCQGGETVCHISRVLAGSVSYINMHGNADACCTSGAGIQQPRIRWTPLAPMRVIVEWFGRYFTSGDQPVKLYSNGRLLHEAAFADFGTAGQTLILEVEAVSTLEMRYVTCTPFDFNLRILTPDCNANNVADAIEIANGTVYDRNHDGVPDPCQCLADVIENGVVDGADLAAVLTVWGTNGGIYPRADTNADGFVDGTDLATVLGGWGLCP